MRSSILQELGLSPLWREKFAVPSVAETATSAVVEGAAVAAESQQVAAAQPQSATPQSAPPQGVAPPQGFASPQSAPQPHNAAPSAAPQAQRLDWIPLKQAVQQCTLCGLAQGRKNPAFGVGDRQADLMLVGEGPGAEEDKQGIPFVGEAGQLLDKMLFAIQRRREDNVYIANIVKCRPPDNRNPSADEAHSCLPYLQQQIALVKPRLLVALGKVAAMYLLNTTDSIAVLRQKIHDYNGIPLVVTYHPAYLLRSPKEKRKSWDDLLFIRSLLQDQ